MTIEIKFDSVRSLLREHNDAVGGEGKPGFVDAEKFFTSLKGAGGTTEDRLKGLSYEDILDFLPATEGVKPKLLAKEIAKIFRGKEEVVAPGAEKRPVSTKHAERMTPRELVENFDPENSSNAIGKVLSVMSKGQPFIVFSSGRIIDVESTLKLLLEVKQGYPGRADYTVGSAIKPVYPLGHLPDNFADENPLYPNRPLRPDGTCDQTGRSWEGVPLEVRQLVRLSLSEFDLSINEAHALLDVALSAEAMTKLRSRYRKSSIKFDELASTGNLPKLKIALGGGNDKTKGGARPFDNGAKVVWAEPPSQFSNWYRAIDEANKDHHNRKWGG